MIIIKTTVRVSEKMHKIMNQVYRKHREMAQVPLVGNYNFLW